MKEIVRNDRKEIHESKILYDENLKNFFIVLLPDSNKVSFWMKNDEGSASGAIIDSPILSKIHTETYNYLRSLSQKTA